VSQQRQNLEFQRNFDFRVSATKLLAKDVYGLDILQLDMSAHPKFKDSYIMYLSIKFLSTEYDNNELNELLKNAKYNVSFGDNHLVFYGDFRQSENLMIDGVILPVKLLFQTDGVFLNILNIKNLVDFVNKVDVKISVSEVIFSEEMENRISKQYARIEQYYERSDGTYNRLNTGSGMGGNGYARNVAIQETDESAITE
jgi:hypothetical protein